MMRSLNLLGFSIFLCIWHQCLSQNDSVYYFILYGTDFGRKFDGIGAVSSGASSALLANYPEKQRNEILDYLFLPNFGASLQILKVEIGGDAQSTDGTELSHMHYPWDENYQRGYEWWLMTEAKKRNPHIKLYGLPYGFPGWLGAKGTIPPDNSYARADYVVKWIVGAKGHYNLDIDYIGVWNEHNITTDYVKMLRTTLDSRGFNRTRIVAPDMKWDETTIIADMHNDPDYAHAVDVVGIRFPGETAPDEALKLGKPIWASADFSTFNNETGGGCLATIINRNYVGGHMSATLSWNLVASYYDSLPFSRHGLMTANEPWSGHYEVDTPVWVTAHTTQFTDVGWTYLAHGSGVGTLARGGSYVAFRSPDGRDLTIVIETLTHKHSLCAESDTPDYSVFPQNMTIQLAGDIAGSLWQMNVWYSKLDFQWEKSVMFQRKDPIPVQHGRAHLTLWMDEIYTITTLDRGLKGQYPPPPPPQPFPVVYSDDFENATIGQQPPRFLTQAGAFEVVSSDQPDHNKVVRQVALGQPVSYCGVDTVAKAITLIGDAAWKDVLTEVHFSTGKVNGTDGVFVAARIQHGGCQTPQAEGVFFFVYPHNQSYAVYYDLATKKLISKGQLTCRLTTDWNSLSLSVTGTQVKGIVNGKPVFNVTAPAIVSNGFVGFGTNSFGLADFDRFVVSPPDHIQGEIIIGRKR